MENNKRKQPIKKVNEIVFMGIMIAIDVVAVRFLKIETPGIRFSMGFLATILAGMYLGPARAGIVGALADLVGFMLFPSGIFFPGFTISAALNGILTGFFLEGKKAGSLQRIIIYAVVTTFLIDTVMNTTWLVILLDNGNFAGFLPRVSARFPVHIIVTVLKIIMVSILYKSLFKRLRAKGVEHAGIRETGVSTIN